MLSLVIVFDCCISVVRLRYQEDPDDEMKYITGPQKGVHIQEIKNCFNNHYAAAVRKQYRTTSQNNVSFPLCFVNQQAKQTDTTARPPRFSSSIMTRQNNVPFPFVNQQIEYEFVIAKEDTTAYPARFSYSVSVLDFTGEMHNRPTYSIFIPKEAIPVIKFDTSVDIKQSFSDVCWSMYTVHFAYSDMHEVFSRDSYASPLLPPILLVGTDIEKFHSDITVARRIAKDKFMHKFMMELSGKPYAQHLVGMSAGIENALEQSLFFVCNKVQDEETRHLEWTFVQVAAQLEKNHSSVYRQIKHILSSCKMQVISPNQLISMVTKNTKMTVAEISTEFKNILSYLHNTRTILHFSQVESLKDIVIPNPHWLAKLFGYVLAYPHSNMVEPYYQTAWKQLKSTGIMHESLLRHILDKYYTDCPSSTPFICYQQLQNLLIYFYLLVCVTKESWLSDIDDVWSGDVFIVPSLAPINTTHEIALTEKKEVIIQYEFHDDVAPTYILNQLIAGCICLTVNRKQLVSW